MPKFKVLFVLTTLFIISACGYHLRGSINLPEGLKRIYLVNASPDLKRTMKKILKSSGGKLLEQADNAGIVIQLIKEKLDKRALSLSTSGRANEYEIIYTLQFNLLNSGGQALSEQQEIKISRDYFDNQEQVLAKHNEEQIIREEMLRNAVRSLLIRARITLTKQP